MKKIDRIIITCLIIGSGSMAFGNEVQIQIVNLTPAFGAVSGGGDFASGDQVILNSAPNPGYVTDWASEFESNVVENSSFEFPGFQEDQPFITYEGSSNAWYFHYVDYFKDVPELATHGSYSVDLNRNPGDPNYVEQQLNQLSIGSKYIFSCDLRLHDSARGSRVRVTIGDFAYASPALQVEAWNKVRFLWTAESANPTLRITSIPGSPTSDGTFLDNVIITKIIPDLRNFSFPATESKTVSISFVPDQRDDDNDGICNYDEIVIWSTNPSLYDSDGDGLGDEDEIHLHQTNPTVSDTDGDGFLDGYEVYTGKSPLNDQDKPAFVAEARTAIEFTFPTALGKIYRIENSLDLSTWTIVENGIIGNGGQIQRFYSTRNASKRYFRVEEDTP